MISTIAMASVLSLWFYKIWIIGASGIVTPIIPLNMLVIAILSAAVFGEKIHRRLT